MRKSGYALRRILFSLAVAIALLLAIECGFRVFLFSPVIGDHPCSPGWNHPRFLVMPDPKAEYTLRPYFQGRLINDMGDFDVPVLINSMGMRDRVLERRPDPKAYNILVLGDSNTFGEGVSWDRTYCALLEKELSRPGRPVKVWNGGVPAYSVGQMRERLDRLYHLVSPQLVILVWSPVTFGREENYKTCFNGYLVKPEKIKYMHPKGANIFYTPFERNSAKARADLWMQSHSIAYWYARFRARERIGMIIERRTKRRDYKVPPMALAGAVNQVLQIKKYCADEGAGFLFVTIKANPENAGQIIRFCEKNGVPAVSLLEGVLASRQKWNKYLFEHDPHLNPEGHKALARDLKLILETAVTGALGPQGGQRDKETE